MDPRKSPSLRTMFIRVSPDDIILYANSSLAAYVGIRKRDLLGAPLTIVRQNTRGEVSGCFCRPESGRDSNHLVTDLDGKVFEVKVYSEGGVMDIVLDDVTDADTVNRGLRLASGTSVDLMNEEELRTSRIPEKRIVTVSYTELSGASNLIDRLPPMETRLMINSFTEEACDAIMETGCTVGETTGDAVLGVYGAPRYFADHALRAIQTACSQLEKIRVLRMGFNRQGKELPPVSCGVWTGDVFVGTLGSSTWHHYTAVGGAVELAIRLCKLSRPGEILLPAFTLQQAISNLPAGWEYIRAESETEPDLSDFTWSGDDVTTLPESLKKVVYLVGPNVSEHPENTELYFDYLWALRIPNRDEPVPILRVVRPAGVSDSLKLSDDKIVSMPAAQTLGKYKLLSVIGSGGMGRVWHGMDRFGNAVAVKVLHASETASEVQLKRFRREAEIMARLAHRNICRVYEMNEFEDVQYIVMEYVDGLTLADLLYDKTAAEQAGDVSVTADLPGLITALQAGRKARSSEEEAADAPVVVAEDTSTRILPIEQTLTIFLRICEAVQFAHEHGVLHRDLKPGNILLRKDGESLVADFGLAKVSSDTDSASLSVSGHVVGTFENMAPEQAASSKDVDERADVYGLGTILFQMLTGRRHFKATGNLISDAQALRNHEPVRPRSLNPHIDPDLEIITLKALRAEPVERYRSVRALKSDIEKYRRGEAISAKPVTPVELLIKLIQRNKAITAVTAAFILILICFAILAFSMMNERRIIAEKASQEAEKERQNAFAEANNANRLAVLALQNERKADALESEEHQAVAKLQAAQKAEKDAQQQTAQATEEAKNKENLLENAQKETDDEKEELRKSDKALKQLQQAQQPKPDAPGHRPAPSDVLGAQRALADAMLAYNLELSPLELDREDKKPDALLSRISEAIDDVSRALLADPSFVPAWLLKGRLHLACMEIDNAKQCFQQAMQGVADNPDPNQAKDDQMKDDDPQKMLAMTTELSHNIGAGFDDVLNALQSANLTQNQNAIAVLQFFQNNRMLATSSSSGTSPLGRTPTPNETAVNLFLKNGASAAISVTKNEDGETAWTISKATDLPDLSDLRAMNVTSLTIHDAKSLDWKTLSALPLQSLDLSNCPISTLSLPQGLYKITRLSLRGTGVQNLGFIKLLPLLHSLDISQTQITALDPLTTCTSLRILAIEDLKIPTLIPVLQIPLESLKLSPNSLPDRKVLDTLRKDKSLKTLRTPGDSPDQSPQEFWKKLDSGMYGDDRNQ